jgi:hypothetical protein
MDGQKAAYATSWTNAFVAAAPNALPSPLTFTRMNPSSLPPLLMCIVSLVFTPALWTAQDLLRQAAAFPSPLRDTPLGHFRTKPSSDCYLRKRPGRIEPGREFFIGSHRRNLRALFRPLRNTSEGAVRSRQQSPKGQATEIGPLKCLSLPMAFARTHDDCQRRCNSPQKWHLKIPQFS